MIETFNSSTCVKLSFYYGLDSLIRSATIDENNKPHAMPQLKSNLCSKVLFFDMHAMQEKKVDK